MKGSFSWLLVSLLVLTVGCGKDYNRAELPQLFVKIGESADPLSFNFPKIGAKDPSYKTLVEVRNTGSVDLTIYKIYLEDGGNPYITLDFSQSPYDPSDDDDFPLVIEPELPAPKLQFQVVYNPEDGPIESNTAVLVIETDDPDYDDADGKYKVVLGVQQVGAQLTLNRNSIVYTCATGCVVETISVDNDGTDILTVDSITFKKASAEYAFPNPPKMPFSMPVKGDPAYYPISFDVRYCPQDDDYEDANQIVIKSNDQASGGNTEIPISVEQAPAQLQWSTDTPASFFDYTGLGGTHTLNVYNKTSTECDGTCMGGGKCCGCPIQVQRVDLTVDGVTNPNEAATWYSVIIRDPGTGNELTLPRGVKGGGSLTFEVAYHRPAGVDIDRNGKICVAYTAPIIGPATRCVDLIATSQCELEIAPINQILYFSTESPADVKEKPVVLINNGTAECVISNITVTDKWDAPTADFTLKDAPEGELKIAPFAIETLIVSYAVKTAPPAKPEGRLNMEYQDVSVGAAVPLAITLKGITQEACMLPLASPGNSGDYPNATVGNTINLNGCGSTAGTCGSAIYNQGYIWFLTLRPEGSAAQLNLEGGCQAALTPDKPGEYEVGLIVYDGSDFLQSDLGTVTISVSE